MATIDSLLVMLGVDLDQQSFKNAQRNMKSLEDEAMDLVKTLGAVGATMLGGAAYLNEQTRQTENLANSIDITTSTLENFGNALRGTEFDIKSVSDLYEELSNKMGESKGLEETAPVIEALTMLKLSFADLKQYGCRGANAGHHERRHRSW